VLIEQAFPDLNWRELGFGEEPDAIIAGPRRATGNLGGGRVLGGTIVASRAGEMIGEIALAMRAGLFAGRLAQTTHAYPTWSLAIQQAAAQFFAEYGGREARPAHPGPAPDGRARAGLASGR
jgi:hypothetical protein